MLVFNVIRDLRHSNGTFEIDPQYENVDKLLLTDQYIQWYLEKVQRELYKCLIYKIETTIADPVVLERSVRGTCAMLEDRGVDVVHMYCREVGWAFMQGYKMRTLPDPISWNDPESRHGFSMRCILRNENNPFTLDLPILHENSLITSLNSLHNSAHKEGKKLAKSYL